MIKTFYEFECKKRGRISPLEILAFMIQLSGIGIHTSKHTAKY